MKLKNNFFAIAFASLMAATLPVNSTAGGSVAGATEFTQLLNNVQLLGMSSTSVSQLATQVQSYGTQALQYVKQLESYANELLNLQKYVPTEIAQAYDTATGMVTAYNNLYGAATDLYGDLSSAKTATENLFSDYNLSGLKPSEYVSALKKANTRQRKRIQSLLGSVEESMKQVGKSYSQVVSYQAKIPYTDGINQQMQLVNSQMNAAMVSQAELVKIGNAQLQLAADQTTQKQIESEATAAALEEELAARAAEAAKIKSLQDTYLKALP